MGIARVAVVPPRRAGNLVASIVTGIEWMVKFAWRIWEQSKIHKFLEEARFVFGKEAALGTRVTGRPGAGIGDLCIEPSMDPGRGGIIHKLDEFKAFYQKGVRCQSAHSDADAQQRHLRELDDAREKCSATTVSIKMISAGHVRHRATSSFTRLKTFGRNYLKNAGFMFTSKSKPVQGLLNHAVNDHSHAMQVS